MKTAFSKESLRIYIYHTLEQAYAHRLMGENGWADDHELQYRAMQRILDEWN